MFEFVITDEFKKELDFLEPVSQSAVKEKLRFILKLDDPLRHSRRLQGHKDLFRFRAGNYRIVFRLVQRRIILFRVRHRKHVYERL